MNILCIDGGGVRGIIPITILEYIEEITNTPTTKIFDSGGGTSTGGIIWGLLSHTEDKETPLYNMKDINDIFTKEVSNIFPDWSLQELTSLKGIIDQRYTRDGLLKVIDTYIGDVKYKDSLNYIVIPAYDIETPTCKLFQNWKCEDSLTVKDVLCATSAAPTYFEPYDKYIDGGIYLNNPTEVSLIQHLERNNYYPDKINIVSLGTGCNIEPILTEDAKDWGLIEWPKPLFSAMMNGQAKSVHLSMRSIINVLNIAIPTTYHRIQIKLKKGTEALDNSEKENVEALRKLALDYIEENKISINNMCKILLEGI